jgi:hypothetical protein
VNEAFILGTKFKIVAKITKVKVNKSGTKSGPALNAESNPFNGYTNSGSPPKWSENYDQLLQYKKEIFSRFEKGIKAEKWDQITPEIISKHIAERLKSDIIIDALCGYGGNAI